MVFPPLPRYYDLPKSNWIALRWRTDEAVETVCSTQRAAHCGHNTSKSTICRDAVSKQNEGKKGPCCPRWVFNIFPTAHTFRRGRQRVVCVWGPLSATWGRALFRLDRSETQTEMNQHTKEQLNIPLDCEDERQRRPKWLAKRSLTPARL